ncbi:MAG: DUF6662 family protein, partial [Limisphaerales bacterium]
MNADHKNESCGGLMRFLRKSTFVNIHCAVVVGSVLGTGMAQADEQFLGFTRGAETLPQDRTLLYQFMTLRTGKAEGSYYGWDFETEFQHGFTDKFQASLSIDNHYLDNHGVNGDRDALDDHDYYRFGGITAAAKYRVLSTFEDPIGLALRLESGYLFHDAVGG